MTAPSLQMTGQGYEYVRCRANGDDATAYIHRLTYVAENGLEALGPGQDVHHKVPIPWLNTPDNLEAVDRPDHARHHLKDDRSDDSDGGYPEEAKELLDELMPLGVPDE